jgi:hypothetical protein
MTASHEKMAALRVAGLHAADRRWITVDQLPRPTHSEPVPVVPAADARVDPLAEHVADWHPDWVTLMHTEVGLPPALADSLRSYRKDVLKESA